MAHFEKYTMMAARQPIRHDSRLNTAGKENIEKGLTSSNYNLADVPDPWQFLRDKIAMSKASGGRFNSRSVACISCVITLPKGFDGDQRLFFETAKNYLDKVFGSDNCISAWVHYDEPDSMPHLHYKATPILVEHKQDRNGHPITAHQFNAKKMVSRSFLRRFHKDLEREMVATFGHPVGILNGATTHGNLTVPQLKKQREELLRLSQEYNDLIAEYDALVDEYNDTLDSIEALKERRKELTNRVAELQQKLDKVKEENARLAEEILGDPFDYCR